MFIEYEGQVPNIAEGAYVAPNAVVRGDVVIHEGAAVLFGAVITAEGGRVEVGTDCVVMEQAVLRGTPRHPLLLGDRTLVGPGCHLTGCEVEPDCFVATGATIFNGAYLGAGSEVRINGVVHVNSRLSPESVVPIGWIAVGDPAEILPPNEHDKIWGIQQTLDFPGTVFKSSRRTSKGERTRSYAKALQRQKKDRMNQSQDLDGREERDMNELGNLPDGLVQRHRSWIQAVNRTDLAAYADLVSENVVWLPPGQTSIEGRDAFETWLAPFFEQYSYEFSIDEPSFRVADNWALEKGDFRSLMTLRSGGEAMEHRGRFIVLWRKDDDARWRIDRYVDDTLAVEAEN